MADKFSERTEQNVTAKKDKDLRDLIKIESKKGGMPQELSDLLDQTEDPFARIEILLTGILLALKPK